MAPARRLRKSTRRQVTSVKYEVVQESVKKVFRANRVHVGDLSQNAGAKNAIRDKRLEETANSLGFHCT